MKPFRRQDEGTEVALLPFKNMVEIYVLPLDDSGKVLAAHFSARMAFRMSCWLFAFWILERWAGIKEMWETRLHHQELESGAAREDSVRVDDRDVHGVEVG